MCMRVYIGAGVAKVVKSGQQNRATPLNRRSRRAQDIAFAGYLVFAAEHIILIE